MGCKHSESKDLLIIHPALLAEESKSIRNRDHREILPCELGAATETGGKGNMSNLRRRPSTNRTKEQCGMNYELW